jgi:hypothetical protein
MYFAISLSHSPDIVEEEAADEGAIDHDAQDGGAPIIPINNVDPNVMEQVIDAAIVETVTEEDEEDDYGEDVQDTASGSEAASLDKHDDVWQG